MNQNLINYINNKSNKDNHLVVIKNKKMVVLLFTKLF